MFIYDSINDKGLIESILQKYNVTTIINFVAEFHVDRSIEKIPVVFLETNILGAQNISTFFKCTYFS